MLVKVFKKLGRNERIQGWDEEKLYVTVDAAPVKGAANKWLVEIIAKYFEASKSTFNLKKRLTSRTKILDISKEYEDFKEKINELPNYINKQGAF